MKKIFLSIICLFICTQFCYAINDNSKKLSLNEAISIAIKENPQNKMAKIDVDIAKKEVKIANKLENPSIYATQNLGKAGEANTNELGVSYTVPLFKRMHLKRVAKANVESAANTQIYKENELIYNVKEAYFELLHRKTILKIMEYQKTIAKEILDNEIQESKKGKSSETDVVLAKIEYNSAIMNYNEAKFEVVLARNNFNAVMDTKAYDYDIKQDYIDKDVFSDLLTLSPTDNSIKFEDIKNYTFSHRHDLLGAKADVKSAVANLSVIKSQLIPDLEAKAAWLYLGKNVTVTGNMENGALLEVGLANIPLVYQYKPEIQKAKLEIEKAKLKYRDLEIDVTRHLTEVWERYLITKNNLNFYNKELLANSFELQEVSLKNFKKNKISMAEYLIAKQKYTDLMINYSEAMTEYYITYARLLKEIDTRDINVVKASKL